MSHLKLWGIDMSVKIKINWDNENVVSESVRIYRADSTFTSNNLPPLLAEIIGDVYEYEDLSVIENKTYYYMLSAKISNQEVFTECYEVKASTSLWLSGQEFITMSQQIAQKYHAFDGTATRSDMGASLSGTGKWSGGVLGSDGKIYCVPNSGTNILIIDPVTQTATRSDMGASLSGDSKWFGGVLGSDGKIYCVPNNSTDILIIDPVTQTATRSAMGASLSGVGKWFGGVLGSDGKIYCVPNNSTDILIIDKNSTVSAPSLKFLLSPHINKL